jgi:hypothetical protein
VHMLSPLLVLILRTVALASSVSSILSANL